MPDYADLQIVNGGFDQLPYGVSWRHLDGEEAAGYAAEYGDGAGADLIDVQGGSLVLVPVIWAASLSADRRIGARHLIRLQEGANLTLIHLAVQAGQPGETAAQTREGGDGAGTGSSALHLSVRAVLERGAHLHIVNVQLLGTDQAYTLDVSAEAGDHAGIEETLIELGGSDVMIRSNAQLYGAGAAMDCHAGILAASGRKEIGIVSSMTGAGSTGCAEYDGAVYGNAAVDLRTAADLLYDAAADGSFKGREELLSLSPDAEILSGPQIRRDGAAADTGYTVRSGKPDEKKVFYLRSRGMDAAEASKRLALAGMLHAAGRIPEERVVQLVSQYVRGVLGIG